MNPIIEHSHATSKLTDLKIPNEQWILVERSRLSFTWLRPLFATRKQEIWLHGAGLPHRLISVSSERSLLYGSSRSNTPLTAFIGIFLTQIILTRTKSHRNHQDCWNRSDPQLFKLLCELVLWINPPSICADCDNSFDRDFSKIRKCPRAWHFYQDYRPLLGNYSIRNSSQWSTRFVGVLKV